MQKKYLNTNLLVGCYNCFSYTYHWILAQIIVCPSSYCVQLHQILKVTDLSLYPFLKKNFVVFLELRVVLYRGTINPTCTPHLEICYTKIN